MTYNYKTIDVPSATSSDATGINLLGQIVGFSNGANGSSGVDTGFIDNNGSITSVSPSGAVSSQVNDINLFGAVVGSYATNSAAGAFVQQFGQSTTLLATGVAYEGLGINVLGATVGETFVSTGFSSGYILQNGTLTTVAEPGAHNTYASSINDLNQVAGYAPLPDGTTKYFIYNQGTFTNIAAPSGTIDVAAGSTGAINDLGQFVGSYTSGNETMGFIYQGGNEVTLAVPGATETHATALNNLGEVIGTYTASGTEHGFVYAGGHFSTIDVPGASTTTPHAINDLGQVVGSYTDSSGMHGFVASPQGSSLYSTVSDVVSRLGTLLHFHSA